nr:hypothetical protein [Actinomycetota bacterium]
MSRALRQGMTWFVSFSLIAGLFIVTSTLAPVATQIAKAAVESTTCVSTPQTGRVSGLISNKSSGTEVAYTSGARVRLIDLDEEIVVSCVIADSTGRYAIDTNRTGGGYLISVDPAPGAPSSLGSTGGAIRLINSSIIRNYSFGIATYQGVATFNGAYPTDTYICLHGNSASRCGFVVSRSDSESPRFALYDGGLQGEVYSLTARKKSDGVNLDGYLDIAALVDSSNIEMKMQAVVGDVSRTNGCVGGKTPNVVGRVTLGGSAYVTTVKLGQDWEPYSSTTAPTSMYLALTTTSAADGSYQFCVDTSVSDGVPKVLRAVATVANLGTNPALGDTYSTWVDSSCLLAAIGCEIPSFEMKEKFLWGTIVVDGDGDASTPSVPLSNANIDINKNSQSRADNWYGSFRTDTLGRFSVSDVPKTGEFSVYVSPTPSCDISSSTCNAETDLNSSALSKSLTLTLGGSPHELNVEVDRGNLGLFAVDPDGYELSTRYSGGWARIVPSNDACRVELVAENYSSQCRVEISSAYYEKSPSMQIAKLATGTYDILMSANGFATSMSTVSVSATGTVSVVSGPLATGGGNRFIQKVSDGNMKFKVNTGSDLNQVAPDSIMVDRYYSSGSEIGYSQSEFQGFIDEDGYANWNAPFSGIYKFSFAATSARADLAGYVTTDVIYEIQVTNGVASILHTCSDSTSTVPGAPAPTTTNPGATNPSTGGTPTCLGDAPTLSNGSVQVSLKKANFEGEVCAALPANSCSAPTAFYPMIRLTQSYPTGSKAAISRQLNGSKFYLDLPYVSSASNALNMTLYTVSIRLSNRGLYANQIRILKVAPSGVISYCGSNVAKVYLGTPCSSPTNLSVDSATGRTVLPSIRLRQGNVIGKVLEPGNSSTVVSDSRICFVDSARPASFCSVFSTYLDPFNSYTDEKGEFAVDLDPGTYSVQASPGNSENGSGSEYSEGTST